MWLQFLIYVSCTSVFKWKRLRRLQVTHHMFSVSCELLWVDNVFLTLGYLGLMKKKCINDLLIKKKKNYVMIFGALHFLTFASKSQSNILFFLLLLTGSINVIVAAVGCVRWRGWYKGYDEVVMDGGDAEATWSMCDGG